MKISSIILTFLIFLGCQEKNNANKSTEQVASFKYLMIKRNGSTIDTTYRIMTEIKLTDSVYNLAYQYMSKSDTVNENFTLTINNTSTNLNDEEKDYLNDDLSLIAQKEVKYQDKTYTVYKYYFDLEEVDDEQMLYFFVPEFGVIINKSAWWGNYDRLIDNGRSEDGGAIFFICEMILYDSEFYKNY